MKAKRPWVDAIKETIREGREIIHPVEYAQACREIEIYCAREADRQEEDNDKKYLHQG